MKSLKKISTKIYRRQSSKLDMNGTISKENA